MARSDHPRSLPRRIRPVAAMLLMTIPFLVQPVGAQTVTTPQTPNGLPYKGLLQLKGGNTTTVAYDATGVVNPPAGLATSQTLVPTRRNDCRLLQPQTSQLLGFYATQGGITAPVGLVTGSLGVYAGSQGTPCSRFVAALGHELTVDLGQQLEGAIPNVAFYRLELDIEAKSNLALELQILRDGVATDSYFLRTGSSIVAGEGSDLPGSPDRIFNCRALSDSGPDSGSRDNCRWVVNELGQGFRLKPLAGEGSLEGGGDPGTPFTNIYLTEAVIGALGCDATNDDTDTLFFGQNVGKASCQVSRFDPSDVPNQTVGCTQPVGYILRKLNGSAEEGDGCELLKSPGEQIAAFIDIAFPPERRTALGAEVPTKIFFSTGQPSPNDLAEFTPERCIGTVVQDQNGNFSIAEVLQTNGPTSYPILYNGEPLSATNDPVPGNDTIEWACILDNAQYYLQKANPPVCADSKNECMQVQQTILFWGDIRFSRE